MANRGVLSKIVLDFFYLRTYVDRGTPCTQPYAFAVTPSMRTYFMDGPIFLFHILFESNTAMIWNYRISQFVCTCFGCVSVYNRMILSAI